jgi:DNA-binding LacI/PurR family transcriptional regulator
MLRARPASPLQLCCACSQTGPVSEEVWVRARQVIHVPGYYPNRIARSFRAQRSKFIGLIIPECRGRWPRRHALDVVA